MIRCDINTHGLPSLAQTMIVLFLLVFLTGVAHGESCFGLDLPLLFDTTANPQASPDNPKAHGLETFLWNGVPHLMINTGNELQVSEISDPQNPGSITDSEFNVPPYGDRDYNLFRFSVCDECRYGSADFDAAGSVLFDLGSDTDPTFGTAQHYTSAGVGRMTFIHGGHQYLVANGFAATCGSDASLHGFNGTGLADLPFLDCFAGPVGGVFRPAGGAYVQGPGGQGFLYLSDGFAMIHIFRLIDGPTLGVEYLGAPISGSHYRGEGWAIDHDAKLFVGVFQGQIQLFDITDPASPQLLSEWLAGDLGPLATLATMKSPLLWIGRSDTNQSATYDISDPTDPAEIDRGIWAECHPWNSFTLTKNQDAELTSDGQWLLLSRFSVVERIRVDPACPGLIFGDGLECGNASPWTIEYTPR